MLHKFKRALLAVISYRKYSQIGISSIEYLKLFLFKGKRKRSRLFNAPILFTDKFWYKHGLKELFIDKTYDFNSNKLSPKIIDCGANIGLSTIFFKKRFPNAEVIAFEPDVNICKILKENLSHHNFDKITVVNKAVWVSDELLSFRNDGSVGGNIVKEGAGDYSKVQATRLKNYLKEPVDFLKIDIEGAEYEVVKDCRDELKNVANLFIEYHSSPEEEQKLPELLQIIREAGFRIYIKEAWENMRYPFVQKKGPFYDLQLNIFAYRR